jgi:hypothetical protein
MKLVEYYTLITSAEKATQREIFEGKLRASQALE